MEFVCYKLKQMQKDWSDNEVEDKSHLLLHCNILRIYISLDWSKATKELTDSRIAGPSVVPS